MKNDEQMPFPCEDIPLARLKKIKQRRIDVRTLRRIRSSIEEVGLLEPLHVCPLPEGNYAILEGDGRYDALSELGAETAPCFIFDVMDIYTANHQVNHLSPVEEAKMFKKAMEVVDEKTIAKVFGLQRIDGRLNETLLKRLHPVVVKAFNAAMITKNVAQELSYVTMERQLEIFATMQNNKNFTLPFVKTQILTTPLKKRQETRKRTPWTENKNREKSLGTNLKEMRDQEGLLASMYREYTAALVTTAVHAREIINKKPLEKYLREKMESLYNEIKEIIESELLERKGS